MVRAKPSLRRYFLTDPKKAQKMPRPSIRVAFEPLAVSCMVPEGQTIMAAAASQKIDLRSDCGGRGKCGKCGVQVSPAAHVTAAADNEARLLPEEARERGIRLACQARITGPLSVSIIESDPDLSEPEGKHIVGAVPAGEHLHSLAYRSAGGSLGLAVDIGTTTVALYLCDLRSGDVVHSAALTNPQRRFGEDVISRIAYANDADHGLKELQNAVVEAVNLLIDRSLEKTGRDRREIGPVTVVGNTTMQHIFCGLDPCILGVSPYMPESCAARLYRAQDVGLALKDRCAVYLFPVVSGFVGGDTVGTMLCERPYLRDQITLLIDIGTNGEIVLGNREAVWVTSCATGPALEGAHLSCGMRASTGAIDKVAIDPVSYRVDYEMIGSDGTSRPRGLCGSGIVDAVAEMVQAGLILPSGRLNEGLPGVIVDPDGIGREFVIAPQSNLPAHKPLTLTLTDIRQVQLAKSALYTGIKLLMKTAKIDRFDRLVLTGAFGARFNWRNGIVIGMLPEIAEGTDVALVDNGAGQGAIMALLDERLRDECSRAAADACLLELAGDPDFAREFALHTMFPQRLK